MIDFLIFFITSKCNSNCKFCFYKDKLNANTDLSLEEIKTISSKIGYFSTLLFSGGEPFLRNDLPEIVNIFISQNKVKSISIPTNGLDTENIISITKQILGNMKKKNIKFSVSPSIDALENLNTGLRGRSDAFASVIKTIKELGSLKRCYKNLSLLVNSVFSNDSSPDCIDLIKLIGKFDYVDFHNIEVLRPNLYNGYSPFDIDLDTLKKVHLFATKTHRDKLINRILTCRNPLRRVREIIRMIIWLGRLRYAQIIKENFLEGNPSLFRCQAGKHACVIEANGDVKLCELRQAVGNLRDNNYNLQAILESDFAQEMLVTIEKTQCNCTHVCFIDDYINFELNCVNLKVIFLISYYYLKFIFFNSR